MICAPTARGAPEAVSENSIHKVDFAMHRENRLKLAARMRDAGASDHSLLVCSACLLIAVQSCQALTTSSTIGIEHAVRCCLDHLFTLTALPRRAGALEG
jgi:hypothetical protein